MKALHWSSSVMAMLSCLISTHATVVVNSLEDVAVPEPGIVTLRSALAMAAPGEAIVFDPSLNGSTIELSIVGQEHSTLVAELMGMDDTPSGPISYLIGYEERDYGRSALYARKNVVIDASALPRGITIRWTGGDEDPARVLAVYGNLTMRNVSVCGGRSVSVELVPDPLAEYPQKSTRARGGGLAVWGAATLENCRLYDNSCFQPWNMEVRDSREGGVFGGGIYADVVQISDCVISGNSLGGAGVSGGGVFTVGGRSTDEVESIIERSAVTGNTIAGIFAYGGGVYSDGGGIGLAKTLTLLNCTVATNEVGMYGPGFLYGIGYWRGSGVYMSNGYMELRSCTIVDNAVNGLARTDDLEKPNLAGGVAATIGNAHAVEHMKIGHCIIAGNWVHPFGGASYNEDIFTGSLFDFISEGFNCIGVINFDQMLVPTGQFHGPAGPPWASLCRKHYPKQGDQYGVILDDIIDPIYGTVRCPDIVSLGIDTPSNAVIAYIPKGNAVDQVPAESYLVDKLGAFYMNFKPQVPPYTFIELMLGRIEAEYGLDGFAARFTAEFETFLASVDLDGDDNNGLQPYTNPDGYPILTLGKTRCFGPPETWPSLLENYPYIEFWHQLDDALARENIPGMGPWLINDNVWDRLFDPGDNIGNDTLIGMGYSESEVQLTAIDQNQTTRPVNDLGDIGAVEYIQPPSWGKFVSFKSWNSTYADTADWLGMLEISLDPWIWCERALCWFNIPAETANAGHGWVYSTDHDSLMAVQVPGTNWVYSFALSKWLYLTPSGWVYLM